jgi:hypothetical protein
MADGKKSMSDRTRSALLLAALLGTDSVVEITKTSSDDAKRPSAYAEEAERRSLRSAQIFETLMKSMSSADNAIALYYAIKQANCQLATGGILVDQNSAYAATKTEHDAAMATCLRVAKALRDVQSLAVLAHLRWTEGKELDRLVGTEDAMPLPGAAATGCLKVMFTLFMRLPCKEPSSAATPAATLAATSDAAASAKLAAGDAAMKARFASSKCPCDGGSCTTSTLPPWPEFSPRAEPAVPTDQRLGRIGDEEDEVHDQLRRDGEVEDDDPMPPLEQ